MAFTKTAEYALRASVELARAAQLMNADEIAERTRVPRPYLVKVLQQLQAAGLVESFRGKSGGWRLSPEKAHQLTLYDVVHAVDPITRVDVCLLGLEAHREVLCPLHTAINDAFASLEASLRGVRVLSLACDSACPRGASVEPAGEPEPEPAYA